MKSTVEWNLRDPWCLGYLGLAVLLGSGIGWPAGMWLGIDVLPTLCVVAAVLVGVLRPARAAVWSASLGVLLLTATVLAALTWDRVVESVALASSAALAHAAAIALPVGLVTLARRRREHRRQGWDLARALAAEETARAESALVRERAAMAGEIHDHLGHRLTLLTVQVGQLTLDPDLSPAARQVLGRVRGGLADAAGELGETVQLLKAGGMPILRPADRSPTEVVQEARTAGLPVEGELPDSLDEVLSPHARSAVVRVLSEGLTNAAKHAPEQAVRLTTSISDSDITLILRNRVLDPASAGGHGPTDLRQAGTSGHGLRSLRHRLALLGGRLDASQDEEFVLRATVPVDAAPGPEHSPAEVVDRVARTQQAAEAHARRAGRLAWLIPAGLAAGAALLTVGFYLYLAIASTLSPAEFARVEVGMPQEHAEDLLPPVQMIEAPREVLAEPAGATCRYHEESVSLFAREDVFRICFAGDRVVSTDTIPAPADTDGTDR